LADHPLRASGHNGAMSTQRISDKVAAQLRGLVHEQQLQPGDRLPAERTLAHATAIAAQAVGQIGFGITDRAQLAELEAAVRLQPLSQ